MRKFSSIVLGALFVASSLSANTGVTLKSTKVNTEVSMEHNDMAWGKAKPIEIVVDQFPYKSTTYNGITSAKVKIQSVYDDKNIYFKVQYADPTKSVDRYPWEKQPDGTWKQLKEPDQFGRENKYYEDRVAMYWNINARGFDRRGCAVACHMAENGKINGVDAGKTAGRKFTRIEGQTIDMWHSKAQRTDPVGQMDDQYVNHYSNGEKNRNWGRMGDERTGGGTMDNISKDKKTPAYVSCRPTQTPNWILDEDKMDFVDNFKAGDRVPAVILKPYEGSRGDISVNSKWENGEWVYVIKRALVTNHPKSAEQDVQFSDLSKTYHFGVAVFDNAQINHAYHDGSISLQFEK